MSPLARSAWESEKTRLAAPRILNAPPFCRFSHLKNALTPDAASKVLEVRTGVFWAMGRMRAAASRTIASVTFKGIFAIVGQLTDGESYIFPQTRAAGSAPDRSESEQQSASPSPDPGHAPSCHRERHQGRRS